MSHTLTVAEPNEPFITILDLDARHALAERLATNEATISAAMAKAEACGTPPALRTSLIATVSHFNDVQGRLTKLLESGAPSYAFAPHLTRLAECEASAAEQMARDDYSDMLDRARNGHVAER